MLTGKYHVLIINIFAYQADIYVVLTLLYLALVFFQTLPSFSMSLNLRLNQNVLIKRSI
jgi:hypothetical protein